MQCGLPASCVFTFIRSIYVLDRIIHTAMIDLSLMGQFSRFNERNTLISLLEKDKKKAMATLSHNRRRKERRESELKPILMIVKMIIMVKNNNNEKDRYNILFLSRRQTELSKYSLFLFVSVLAV